MSSSFVNCNATLVKKQKTFPVFLLHISTRERLGDQEMLREYELQASISKAFSSSSKLSRVELGFVCKLVIEWKTPWNSILSYIRLVCSLNIFEKGKKNNNKFIHMTPKIIPCEQRFPSLSARWTTRGNLCLESLDRLISRRRPRPRTNKLIILIFDFVFYRFKTYAWKKEFKSLSICETAENICCPAIG